MALHGTNMAVASEAGVVNMYDLSPSLPGTCCCCCCAVLIRLCARDLTRLRCQGPRAPSLRKAFMNLTTPVETMRFNHDGQLLGMGTRWDKNSFRLVGTLPTHMGLQSPHIPALCVSLSLCVSLCVFWGDGEQVHVPTCTVFSNWPTSKTPLGYIFSMDFSPSSGFIALGNDKGKVLLYRVNHYRST
jgi:U3 small nucleolar RNA-associated protein 18